MKTFDYAPEVVVGTIFKRIDRNGKVWEAKVINRTKYFVDVEKTQPYQIKVIDDGVAGQCGCWHYEDAGCTKERAQIIEEYVDVKTDEFEEVSVLYSRTSVVRQKVIKVKTRNYYLNLKEINSKYSNYDKRYKFTAPISNKNTVDDGIKLFYKYCDEN